MKWYNHRLNISGQYIYGPESEEAASTIKKLTHSFCREYKVNQDAINSGSSGILIGRYPGDHYAGGNPWQLLTAVLGETFYLGAQATISKIQEGGDYKLGAEEHKEWVGLLDTLNSKLNWERSPSFFGAAHQILFKMAGWGTSACRECGRGHME